MTLIVELQTPRMGRDRSGGRDLRASLESNEAGCCFFCPWARLVPAEEF